MIQQIDSQSVYIPLAGNPGCAAGLKEAEKRVSEDSEITHVLVVDDDAELLPGCIDKLIEAIHERSVGAAVPLIEDEGGRVTSFAGKLAEPMWSAIKVGPLAAEFHARFANQVLSVEWFPGVCFVFRCDLLGAVGLHDSGFWMMGEDLDYSLRLTSAAGGVLVVDARAKHLPPTPQMTSRADAFSFVKALAMVMNSLFLAIHTSHGRPLRRHIAGNVFRFVRKFRNRKTLWRDLTEVAFLAIVKRERAGDGGYSKIRAEHLQD